MIELDIPAEVDEADEAVEMARVFIGDGASIIALRLGVLGNEPQAWGALIADILSHVANGLAQSTGARTDEILSEVEAGFRERASESPFMAGRLFPTRN